MDERELSSNRYQDHNYNNYNDDVDDDILDEQVKGEFDREILKEKVLNNNNTKPGV